MSTVIDRPDLTGLSPMELLFRVEAFFREEADILDERRYQEWLDLLTEDMSYVAPLARNISGRSKGGDEFTREGLDAMWFDEGKDTLTQRVKQIATGIHWAEEPVSRTSHIITNVRVLDVAMEDGGCLVRTGCRFLLYRNRLEDEVDIYVGKRKDTLLAAGNSFQIKRREIYLDQNVLLAKNFTTFF